ncbi:MAG: toxin-antitoxin system YwqK family antitoxin [Cytophagaceae bacterium]|nr:toxin-antitoxin system YwqK family antitoxin [Cytophagaceae bacterium]MDW8456356.1 toxin-antitoxin system YwqK family antitoxin [Cytophagaceae bacterium]
MNTYAWLHIIPVVLFITPLCAQRVKITTYYDAKKTIIKEEYYVLKKNTTVPDSTFKLYYQNGKINREGNFTNGKVNGIWKYYYENGNLKMEGPFKDGEHSGYWVYYFENGNKNMEGNIFKDIKEGEWKYYYENGQLKTTGAYKKNKKTGLWKYYHEDGTIKAQATFENDKGRYTELYPNGQIKCEGNIVDGKSEGEWKYYHENGKLKAIGLEKNGLREGYWKFYYPNDSLHAEGMYLNGKEQGKWKYYYDNGKLSEEGEQIEGKKDGYWKLYYKTGSLKGEAKYDKGDGPYREYYESGKLKMEGNILNGKNDGLWKYYYESGALEGQCYFTNGQGKYTGYYEDGTIKMEGMLKDGNKDGIWKLFNPNGQLAGYYKTYYENDIPYMRPVDSTATKTNIVPDSIGAYEKPRLRIRKKKSRHFTPKLNEFRGFIVSAGPFGILRRTLPLSVEYYMQERLGYEINYTLHRAPLLMSDIEIPDNEYYKRGYSLYIRQKFYDYDRDNGMWYYGHELRYTNVNYSIKIKDTLFGPNSFPITKQEKLFEYSILIGNRLMQDSKKEGFTLDIFAGIGIGYRHFTPKWKGYPHFDVFFNGINLKPISVPFRFGINVGYVFKTKRKK